MDVEEILAHAKASAEPPSGWSVFPIIRWKIIIGMLEWTLGIIMGLGLFALIASIVIPYNYQHGVGPAIFSTIFLGVLLFVFGGSVYLFVVDMLRLIRRDRHIIVITPHDFVKQEGRKIIHIPLPYVRHVTPRGKRSPTIHALSNPEESTLRDVPDASENMAGLLFGRGLTASGRRWRRGRMRTPSTLAFVDARSSKEVLVVNDTAYGDPFFIGDILKYRADTAQESAV